MFDDIKVARYEIVLKAGKNGLILPSYKGSTLRGGFGAAFQRVVCSQKDQQCHRCLLMNNCPYAYIFETAPPPGSKALRNYENIPRPFVLEPPLETKTFYGPGERLTFQLVLFGKAINYLPYFIVVFRELGNMGMGKGRRPFYIDAVKAINIHTGDRTTIYDGNNEMVTNLDVTITGKELGDSQGLDDFQDKPNLLTIRFLTMSRLKFAQEYATIPEFHVIIRNLLRRLSSISYFHHGIEPQLDFPGLIEKAQSEVTLIKNETRWEDWERIPGSFYV